MKSMEMLSALLPPGGERPLALSNYVGLQALLDAVPVALMEYRLLRDGCLVLLSANTAARRTPGLGAVHVDGADARTVFDQLADYLGTHFEPGVLDALIA